MRTQFRRTVTSSLAVAFFAAGLIAHIGYSADESKPADKEKSDAKSESKAEPAEPKRVSQDAEGNAVVTLNAATQERIDLKTAALTLSEYTPSIVAYGIILNPGPLALLDLELRGAEFATQTSRAQAERARKLFADDANVSKKSLEIAEAQARADEIHLDTARQRLEIEWGPLVSRLTGAERGGLVERLKSHKCILARADLPLIDAPKEKIDSAWFTVLGSPGTFIAAVIAPAPTLDPTTQAIGYFLEVTNAEPATAPVPGAAVTAHLVLGAKSSAGLVLPRSAILRSNGAAWVYVQTAPESFTRRSISLDKSVESGWFVTTGFKAGDKVVVQGGAILLSEELKNLGGGGD